MRVDWPRGLERIQLWCVVVFAAVLPVGKSPAEVALGVGVAVWLARTVLVHRRPIIPSNPLTIWLIAWFLIGLVSISNSVDIGTSLRGLQKLVKHFAWYLVVIDAVRSSAALRRVVWGVLAGLGVLIADTWWQAAVGWDLFYGNPPTTALEGAVRRLQGPFDHPASLAIHLVTFLPVLFAWTSQGLPTRQRRVWWVLGGGGLLALVFSWNRGGFAGLLVGLAVLAIGLRRWAPLIIAAATAALQVLLLPPAVKTWVAGMPSLLHQFTQPDRLVIWQTAWDMIRAHPILGVGINAFAQTYPAYAAPEAQYGSVGPYAHNLYLHMAAELGVAGFVILVGIVARLVWGAVRQLREHAGGGPDAAIGAGFVAGLAGYLTVGLVESSLYYGRGSLTFWLIAGLLVAWEQFMSVASDAPLATADPEGRGATR